MTMARKMARTMGMRHVAGAACIVSALACGSPLAVAGGVEEPDLFAGRNLAERHCAACHAIGRTGASPNDAAPPFRLFSSRWPIESLAEALAEGIVTGHPDMPTFTFSAGEIDDFLGWLDSVQAARR